MKRLLSGLALASIIGAAVIPGASRAFDVVDRKTSYVDSKFVTLGLGMGIVGFARQSGVSGDLGFGFKLTGGHHFNQYLAAEILYQFATFPLDSPDPVVAGAKLHTRAESHQEVIRGVLTYPAVVAQPFLTAGIGGYSFSGVDKETGLNFPIGFQIPLGAGVQSYVYKDVLSFDIEFNYQFLFGENQSADTLTLLGVPKVAFDTYSVMATFTLHLQ